MRSTFECPTTCQVPLAFSTCPDLGRHCFSTCWQSEGANTLHHQTSCGRHVSPHVALVLWKIRPPLTDVLDKRLMAADALRTGRVGCVGCLWIVSVWPGWASWWSSEFAVPELVPDVPPKLVLDLAPTRPLLPQTGPAIQLRCGKPSTLILTRCMGGGGFAL